MLRWILSLLGLFSALAAACDGGDPGATTSGTSSAGGAGGSGDALPWEQFCEKAVERDLKCYPENPPAPTLEECKEQEPCFKALYRDDVEQPLLVCLTDRPCDKFDDACIAEVALATTPSAAASAYRSACEDKRGGCPSGSFSGDWCEIPSALRSDDVLAELSSCLQEPCDQVGACFEGVIKAKEAPCGGGDL